MTVKELIAQLKTYDPEVEVILQKDAEGNGYSPLADIEGSMVYIPESNYGGEVSYIELTPELEKFGFTEEDIYKGDDATKCVILSPIN